MKRTGIDHQAGSDAHYTILCFHRLNQRYFTNGIPRTVANKIFGLGRDSQNSIVQQSLQHLQNHHMHLDGNGYMMNTSPQGHYPYQQGYFNGNGAFDHFYLNQMNSLEQAAFVNSFLHNQGQGYQ